jgi:hypothetical protein
MRQAKITTCNRLADKKAYQQDGKHDTEAWDSGILHLSVDRYKAIAKEVMKQVEALANKQGK